MLLVGHSREVLAVKEKVVFGQSDCQLVTVGEVASWKLRQVGFSVLQGFNLCVR